jgi:hypothetical protein
MEMLAKNSRWRQTLTKEGARVSEVLSWSGSVSAPKAEPEKDARK